MNCSDKSLQVPILWHRNVEDFYSKSPYYLVALSRFDEIYQHSCCCTTVVLQLYYSLSLLRLCDVVTVRNVTTLCQTNSSHSFTLANTEYSHTVASRGNTALTLWITTWNFTLKLPCQSTQESVIAQIINISRDFSLHSPVWVVVISDLTVLLILSS